MKEACNCSALLIDAMWKCAHGEMERNFKIKHCEIVLVQFLVFSPESYQRNETIIILPEIHTTKKIKENIRLKNWNNSFEADGLLPLLRS
jgi:hypothetical protein